MLGLPCAEVGNCVLPGVCRWVGAASRLVFR